MRTHRTTVTILMENTVSDYNDLKKKTVAIIVTIRAFIYRVCHVPQSGLCGVQAVPYLILTTFLLYGQAI